MIETNVAANRRGVLRGLISLPLIGGGVTLIGAPSAAAVPVTTALMERYSAFLLAEAAETLVELEALKHCDHVITRMIDRRAWCREAPYYKGMDVRPDLQALICGAPPSTRPAVVLGVWRHRPHAIRRIVISQKREESA